MRQPLYQVLLLGGIDDRIIRVKTLLHARLRDLGLDPTVIHFENEPEFRSFDRRLPAIAIFVGYIGATDASHPILDKLIQDSTTILTIVSSLELVGDEVPAKLSHINAIALALPDINFDRVVSLILEQFRLLRRERRLFISYKRDDSQSVATQLYDALDARGFDVFLDTRSVPPGVDFQAELWHRLSDSDVVVLIDTPGFRSSRWTKEELARANATNIQILHLLWPGQSEDAGSAFSHFEPLSPSKFARRSWPSRFRRLNDAMVVSICDSVEKLRAKAIAARYRYLVDSFCDAARDLGLIPTVQPERWILVRGNTETIAAVPTIGVPTSDRIHATFDSISASEERLSATWVLYDGRGLLTTWLDHLGWLDKYLPIKSVAMASAFKALEIAPK